MFVRAPALLTVASLAVAGAVVPAPAPAGAEVTPAVVAIDTGYVVPNYTAAGVYDTAAGAEVTLAGLPDSGGVRFTYRMPNELAQVIDLLPPAGGQLAASSLAVQPSPDATKGALRVPPCANAATGTVDVTELTRAGDGAVTSLAASWSVSCGNGDDSHGELRYGTTTTYRAVRATVAGMPGTRFPGTTGRTVVTLTSLGTEPLAPGPAVADGDASLSVAEDTCDGATVAPGQACTVAVDFTPVTAGPAPTILRLPDSTRRGTREIRLGGQGVAVPALHVYPGVDGFGFQPASVPWVTTPIFGWRVYRVDGAAPELVASSPGTLAYPASPGTTATFRLAPVTSEGEAPPGTPVTATVPESAPATGPYSGVSQDRQPHPDLPYDTQYSFETHAANVTATGGPGRIDFRQGEWAHLLSIESLDGGPLRPGTGTARVFVSSGCGETREVTIHEVAVRADHTPVTLAASVACPLYRAELRWKSTRPYVAAAVQPVSQEFFGVTRVGATSAPGDLVKVHNTGLAPLVLGTAHFGGSTDWVTVSDGCSGRTVAVGGSCTLRVAFAPDSVGAKRDRLVIPDNTPVGARYVRLDATAGDLPGTVTGVHAAGGSLGWSLLRWTMPPANESGVAGVRISAGTSPTALAVRYEGPASTEALVKLAPGVRQYVSVALRSAAGFGPASAPVAVVPPARALVHARYEDGLGRYSLAAVPSTGGDPMYLDRSGDSRQPTVRRALPASWPTTVVAYSKAKTAYRHVFVVNADGGTAGASTNEPTVDLDPAHSPDGTDLALVRLAPDGRPDVHLKYGSERPQALYRGAVSPSWLPSGRELVVSRTGATTWLEVVAADGSYAQKIAGTDGGWRGAVSPDGTRVAFAHFAGNTLLSTIRVVPVGGGAARVVASPGGYNDNPVWSSDGRTIYFDHATLTGADEVGTSDLWSAAADGPVAAANVTRTPDVDEVEPAVLDLAPPQPAPPVARAADFTGDRRADIAVFRPVTGTWHVRGLPAVAWGVLGDIPVPGDYAGDRRAEYAVFRPSTGTWYVRGVGTYRWGQAGDIPVAADYTGDGKLDLAVYRPSTSFWYIRGRAPFRYGTAGDVPVPGDYNGDRKAEIALYRPSTLRWHSPGWRDPLHGGAFHQPVPADYDGDGRMDIATYAPWSGTWWIDGVPRIRHGGIADQPVVGDFNGDGRADLTTFRPSNGAWYVRGVVSVAHGRRGDVPV